MAASHCMHKNFSDIETKNYTTYTFEIELDLGYTQQIYYTTIQAYVYVYTRFNKCICICLIFMSLYLQQHLFITELTWPITGIKHFYCTCTSFHIKPAGWIKHLRNAKSIKAALYKPFSFRRVAKQSIRMKLHSAPPTTPTMILECLRRYKLLTSKTHLPTMKVCMSLIQTRIQIQMTCQMWKMKLRPLVVSKMTSLLSRHLSC